MLAKLGARKHCGICVQSPGVNAMRRRMFYDILKKENRHLRGKIAELIFDKIKSQLIRESLHCCTTYRLHNFLPTIENSINSYIEALNTAREFLGMQRFDGIFDMLLDKKVGGDLLRERCLLCLKEGGIELLIRMENTYRSFRLCKSCLHICMEKGFIQFKSCGILGYKAHINPRKFRNFIKNLIVRASRIDHVFSEYSDVVEVLSRLDERTRRFLREVGLGPKGPGQYSFDYVCADDRSGKYLIDVTSVRGIDASPPPLSKKEKRVAELAKEAGFKILIPVVRFLHNWRVLVELVEE